MNVLFEDFPCRDHIANGHWSGNIYDFLILYFLMTRDDCFFYIFRSFTALIHEISIVKQLIQVSF